MSDKLATAIKQDGFEPTTFIPTACTVKNQAGVAPAGAWSLDLTVVDDWDWNGERIKFEGTTEAVAGNEGRPNYYKIMAGTEEFEVKDDAFSSITNWTPGDKIIFTYTNANFQ